MVGPFPSSTGVTSYAVQKASLFPSWSSSRSSRSILSQVSPAKRSPASFFRSSDAPYRVSHVICSRPYRSPSGVYGCGQCMPCRINRRRSWTARLVLETTLHDQSVMATLTYADDARVTTEPGNLIPKDLQLFMKRLRHHYAPGIRYYGVGEYGEKSWRPHYHVALFGVGIAEHPFNEKTGFIKAGPIFESWDLGGVHVCELNETVAHYIAGYVTKKMTAQDDPRLEWRYPEFARMSLRPGIGRKAMTDVAKTLNTKGGALAVNELGDIPHEVRIGGTKFPLTRYLRMALREDAGYGNETPPQVKLATVLRRAATSEEEHWKQEDKRKISGAQAEFRDRLAKAKRSI